MRLPVLGRTLGTVLVLPLLAAMIVNWQSSHGHAGDVPAALGPPAISPSPMRSAPTTNVSLEWQHDRRVQALALRKAVNPDGDRVKVGDMLSNAPSHATPNCAAPKTGVLKGLLKEPGINWYCLEQTDADTTEWTPQGVSGTEDAYRDKGTVDGHHAMVFSWHAGPVGVKPLPKGARLTFLDTDTNKYVNVLLVKPTKDGKSYTNVTTHAGGIVWFSHYIFVVSVNGGVDVFDTGNLLQLVDNPKGNTTDHEIGAIEDPKTHRVTYYGETYPYLLPQIGTWHNQDPGTTYDYMSLPANQDYALTGEWCDYKTSCDYRGRVMRWRMAQLLGFESPDFETVIQPTEAWYQPYPDTQGGFSNKCYYFDNGGGVIDGDAHQIIAWPPTASPSPTKPVLRAGAKGLQDLYWRPSDNELWTVTEYTGMSRRVLYGLNRPSCPK